MKDLSWPYLILGVVIGIAIPAVLIHRLGRSFNKKAKLDDRGKWDRPLPEPFDREQVVVTYKRRREGHRRHRDFYLKRSGVESDSDQNTTAT